MTYVCRNVLSIMALALAGDDEGVRLTAAGLPRAEAGRVIRDLAMLLADTVEAAQVAGEYRAQLAGFLLDAAEAEAATGADRP